MDKLTFRELRDLVAATPAEAAKIVLRAGWKEAAALIFEHPDPDAVMAALPAEDAYLLIKQVGERDALYLFEAASSAQVQAMFDFECWNKDRLEKKTSRHWFEVLMETSDEVFLRNVREMDRIFLSLFFKKYIGIERFEDMIDWNPAGAKDTYIPPDRRHLLTYHGDETTVRFIHEFTQRIFRLDMPFYYELIEMLYWETFNNLEEEAYQERAGRMADRGFPDYFAAVEVFTVVNPEKFKPSRKAFPAGAASGEFADAARSRYLQLYEHHDSFLRRLVTADFPGRDEVLTEIIAVANMVSVAERVSVADLDKVRDIVGATNAYLNIGLEYLSDAQPDQGVRVLRERKLLDVYKIGRSLVVELGRRARAIRPTATLKDRAGKEHLMIDPPHRSFITELSKKEPRWRAENGDAAPFPNLDEVRAASARLDQWERAVKILAGDCGLSPEAVERVPMLGLNHDVRHALTYKTLFATAYANDALGRPFEPAPLRVEDVERLYQKFVFADDGNRLTDNAWTAFKEWLDARGAPDLAPLFEEFFQVLADELALAHRARRPDPRYVSSLLVELPF